MALQSVSVQYNDAYQMKKTAREIMGLHPLCDTNIEILPDFINYAKEQGYIFDVISS